jgi:hypothetical protein
VVLAVLAGVVRSCGPWSTTAEPPVSAPATEVAAPVPSSDPPVTALPSEDPGDPDATPTVTSDSGDAGPDPSGALPYSQTAEARRGWEPVVQGFARNFTKADPDQPKAWRSRLARFSTAAVRKELGEVDVTNLPTGRYTDYEVLRYDDEEVAAAVSYDEGWSMVLYVIFNGEDWRVYRYDRLEE